MTMYRVGLRLLFLSLSCLWYSNVSAQALVETKSRSATNYVKIFGSTTILPHENLKMILQWETPTQQYSILSLADSENGVYFAKRFSNIGIEAFGKGPKLIEELRKGNQQVHFEDTNINLNLPYILRQQKDGYMVAPYADTTELTKFFAILDQLLFFRAIPAINKAEMRPMTFTEMEIGEALMFVSRKKSYWK